MRKIGWLIICLSLVVFSSQNLTLAEDESRRLHLVKKGETWSQLAAKHQIFTEELAKINGRIPEDTLYADEWIIIPISDEQIIVPISQKEGEVIGASEEVTRDKKFWGYLTVIVALFIFLIVIRRRRFTKIICKFQDGTAYAVSCRKISGTILCPIPVCDFQDPKPHKMSRHLKAHYKNNQGKGLFRKQR